MDQLIHAPSSGGLWNKGKLVGQKAPLRLKEIWAIRIRLQLANRIRDLALFNLAIDSKLRSCDLVKLRVRDLAHGERISSDVRRTMMPSLYGEEGSRSVSTEVKCASAAVGLRAGYLPDVDDQGPGGMGSIRRQVFKSEQVFGYLYAAEQ